MSLQPGPWRTKARTELTYNRGHKGEQVNEDLKAAHILLPMSACWRAQAGEEGGAAAGGEVFPDRRLNGPTVFETLGIEICRFTNSTADGIPFLSGLRFGF
jgi:hypothetical protein